MTPAEIREARHKTGLNTSDFGALLGVSGRTIQNWEQGRNEPRGPALVLLRQIACQNDGAKGTSSPVPIAPP